MPECYNEAIGRKKIYSDRAHYLNKALKWPLDKKIEYALELIRKALNNSKYPIVSSSWGKDSIVTLHLVHQIDDTVPVLYNDTGVDFPETKKYMKEMTELWNLKVIIAKSEKWTFWKIVEKYGYPETVRGTKKSKYREPMCCKLLKTEPTKKALKQYNIDTNFVGIRAEESQTRRSAYVLFGDYYYSKTWNMYKALPIMFFTEQDIWDYMDNYNIPPHPAYKKYNIPRVGCIPCTGHIGWEEQLAKLFPELYRKIQHDMGQYLIDDYGGDKE